MFADREDGGKALAKALKKFATEDVVVYGLPRGGVVTAKEVADALRAPLDLVITRKIGHPWNHEYALGSIAEDGQVSLNEREVAEVDPEWLEHQKREELKEAKRRRDAYLGGRAPLPAKGKTAIIVDDGIATGYTMLAAIKSVRKLDPKLIVVAAPVSPRDTVDRIKALADEVVILDSPADFFSISQFYEDFSQVSDDEVIAIMGVKVA